VRSVEQWADARKVVRLLSEGSLVELQTIG